MRNVSTWQGALTTSWGSVWSSFMTSLPKVLGAIIVFIIGLILAYWAKRLTVQILKTLNLEKVSKSLGVDKFLKKADVKLNLTELVGAFINWLIVFVFFLAAVDILGLSAVSRILTNILGYIPNVIAAALIFGVGYFVAGIVDGVVRGALASVDHDIAKPVGKIARWLLIVISFFAAVDQLQIARGLITTFFQGLTYTIVLVVGLSVGLGAKDLVSKVLDDWYEKIKK